MSFPLRFGIITVQNHPLKTLIQRWQKIESLGFDHLWVTDHFVNFRNPQQPFFEAWTLLAGMAAHTKKIKIGTLVTAPAYRNPTILARQALTVDHISNGRLIVGIGAGSSGKTDPSFAMSGTPDWGPAEKAERLHETAAILAQLLSQTETTYQGKYYQVKNAIMSPSPLQQPSLPLLVAAMGKKTLKTAAAFADTWNVIGGMGSASIEENLRQVEERSQILDGYCEELGRNPAEIRRSLLAFGPLMEKLFESPQSFREIVQQFREIGISEFISYYPEDENVLKTVEVIAREVIPKLRN